MASKVTRKITEALSDLLQSYAELLEALQTEFGVTEEKEGEAAEAAAEELESSLVNEIRAALELVMDQDDYSADDIASLITSMTEALEEIDPTIFEAGSEEDGEEDEDEDYVVEDEDEDYDEYDEDEEEDDDYTDDDYNADDVEDLDD
jgi:hypothetical protein